MRFDELDLEDEILDGLDDMNFQEMTPVQEHTIPVILEAATSSVAPRPEPARRRPIRCHCSTGC